MEKYQRKIIKDDNIDDIKDDNKENKNMKI